MSNFKKAVLKVAETNERFRKALLEEMRVAESRVPGDDSKGPEEEDEEDMGYDPGEVVSKKTAQDNTASSKVAGMNFMDSLNRLSDKFMDEVADIVGSKLGWIRRRSGIGSYVLTGVDGKYISLSMDMHKLPLMVEVHGDVTPFKAAVYTSRDTASFILKKLGRAMKTAGEHLAGSAAGLEKSVKALKDQVEATKKAIRDFSKNKGDDGKVELVHMYKGRPDKFRMDAKELAKHLKMKERQFKDVSKEMEAAKSKKASGKTASSNSRDIMDAMVPRKDLREVMSALSKAKDDQTLKLLKDSYQFFFRKFELSANEERALNRLRNVMGSRSRDVGNLRNQIFKVADELGMRLPSAMF